MAPVLGDTIRIVCKLSQAGNDIQNVYHALLGGTVAPSNAALLATVRSWMDDAYSDIVARIADNVLFDSIWVWNMTQDEFVGEADWLTLTAGGGGTNSMMPPQTAALCLFRTAVPKSLGKKFLPPMSSLQLEDDGSIISTGLTQIGLYAAVLLAGATGATWNLVPGNYRPLVSLFIPYLSAVVRDLFATQRRRYTGSGT